MTVLAIAIVLLFFFGWRLYRDPKRYHHAFAFKLSLITDSKVRQIEILKGFGLVFLIVAFVFAVLYMVILFL